MYAAPSSFWTALGTGYQLTVIADLWTMPGMLGANGVPIPVAFQARCYVEDGSITVDGTAPQRRTAQLTLAPYADPGHVPVWSLAGPSPGQLNSKTAELRISWAAQPPTGPPFYALLGVLPVTDVEIDDTGEDIVVTVACADRSTVISRHPFTHDYPQANGVLTTVAIQNMIQNAAPDFVQRWDINLSVPGATPAKTNTDWPTAPYTWPAGQDAWAACQQMANTAGIQLYFSPSGRATMRPIPNFQQGQGTSVNPAGGPLWVYTDGIVPQPIGGGTILPMLTKCKRVDTAENQSGGAANGSNTSAVPNSVVVVAENTWLPYGGVFGSQLSDVAAFQVQAVDQDPSSPTYIGGPYGIVSNVIYDDLLVSKVEGEQEALLSLQQGLSAGEPVDLSVLPNPLHEVWDVIKVVRPRIGANALFTILSFTLPLNIKDDLTIVANKVVGPGGLFAYPLPTAPPGPGGY